MASGTKEKSNAHTPRKAGSGQKRATSGADDLIGQHRAILKGAKFEELENLRKGLGLSTSEMAEVVLISQRTLNRRRKEGRLEPDESDRVLRVRRLFTRACTLFDGDDRRARGWFQAEFRELGGESPLSLARTDAGAREVELFIGRIEHGVFM